MVNPSHFYVRYVAEKKESEVLSRKINELCFGEGCQFTLGDTMERGNCVSVRLLLSVALYQAPSEN